MRACRCLIIKRLIKLTFELSEIVKHWMGMGVEEKLIENIVGNVSCHGYMYVLLPFQYKVVNYMTD